MRHTDMRAIRITNIPGQADTILALHAAGVDGVNIARYVGREPNVIWRWIRRQGLTRYPRISEATADEIERLYYEGLYLREIADRVGHDPSSVRDCLDRRGLYVAPYSHMTAREERDIAARYLAGQWVANIAARLGYCRDAIYKSVRRSGIDTTDPRLIGEAGHERIVVLYQDGMKIAHIAKAAGCATATVVRHLRAAGVYDAERSRSTKPARNAPDHPWNREYHGPRGARRF